MGVVAEIAGHDRDLGGDLRMRRVLPALHPVDDAATLDGRPVPRGVMAVLDADWPARIASAAATRVTLLDGEPFDGRPLMWWNFVSTRKEQMVAAAGWEAHRMPEIDGDSSFIPPPDKRPELR